MDAATVYVNVTRAMNSSSGGRNYWKLITLVCFTDADINGAYFTEREYGFLFQLAPNIQMAFEVASDAFATARKELQRKLEAERKTMQKTGS